MDIKKFIEILNADFYTGVPDSKLSALCNYLYDRYGINKKHHIIAANEGNAAALAAGYYLAMNKPAVVYLQNSGLGNIVNPCASLLNEEVYAIPCIFVVGWRAEPDVKDEPQHIFQGKITLKLLEDLDISYFVLSKDTKDNELIDVMSKFNNLLSSGKSVAFVVKKDGLTYDNKPEFKNNNTILRKEAIRYIVDNSKDDFIVSTTGKISRELFEIRKELNQEHSFDFLNVGSMGHCSSVALGVAINKPDKKIWCLDGDGAFLMHMGSIATIGSINCDNFIHIVLNNSCHESVGGMPTVIDSVDMCKIALSCGYKSVFSVDKIDILDDVLKKVKKSNQLSFVEIKCSVLSDKNLIRPDISPVEIKKLFMNELK